MPEPLDITPVDQLASLPRHPSSATAARVLLRGFLGDVKGGERYVDDGELIVTELVTHAVLRERKPEHLLLDVLFEYSAPTGLRITVQDVGLRGRRAGEDRAAGLGVVHQLASTWGREISEGELSTLLVWAQLAPW
ncbi:hypothetical protein [Kitasatospora sp. NPDC093806]|uniref:hypothetical protein n=1 Tax=Kitasatospora sp. NPDC093806 TaxID=3155075 RepID=UPI00341AE8AC